MVRQSPGYSLYELLVTTSLIAALLTIGIPSFGSLLARQRQVVEVNALFHAIHLARKESIMRRKVVSLCPSGDGLQCLGGRDWSSGWLMFENKDGDSPPRVDPGEPILRRHQVNSKYDRQGEPGRLHPAGHFPACDKWYLRRLRPQ